MVPGTPGAGWWGKWPKGGKGVLPWRRVTCPRRTTSLASLGLQGSLLLHLNLSLSQLVLVLLSSSSSSMSSGHESRKVGVAPAPSICQMLLVRNSRLDPQYATDPLSWLQPPVGFFPSPVAVACARARALPRASSEWPAQPAWPDWRSTEKGGKYKRKAPARLRQCGARRANKGSPSRTGETRPRKGAISCREDL